MPEERELTIREACVELFEYHEKKEGRDAFYSFKSDVMKEDSPLYHIYKKISDAMYSIDTGEDFLDSVTVSCLDWLNEKENVDKTIDELRDELIEQIDREANVSNSDLISWFAESLNNIDYVNDAVEEMGYNEEQGIMGMLTAGQIDCIEDIYNTIMNAVEELEE